MSSPTVWTVQDRRRAFETWKAGLRIRQLQTTMPAGRFPTARALVHDKHPCSGVSAGWCPNCGDCTCPRDDEWCFVVHASGRAGTEVVHAEACPLHATDSPHATGVID